MKTLSFKNGDELPAIGLGTWKSEPGDVHEAIVEAVKIGYRHIDCAAIYGNEQGIGKALEKVINDGLVQREELWITSKLWNASHKQGQVLPALKQTLADLRLEYLDLYLIHWPVALKKGVAFPEKADNFISLEEVPISETWKGMEEAMNQQLARHIGVSNFSQKKIEKLLENAQVRPEMNQVELHPLLQQQDLINYCHSEDIHVTAYSPLGSRDRAAQIKKDNEPNLFEEPVIKEIADKHNSTPAQVLISWAVHRGTAVIPKSTNPGRLKQNFEAKDINLDQDDMQQIAGMDRHYRFVDGTFWVMEGNSYTLDNLWDE